MKLFFLFGGVEFKLSFESRTILCNFSLSFRGNFIDFCFAIADGIAVLESGVLMLLVTSSIVESRTGVIFDIEITFIKFRWDSDFNYYSVDLRTNPTCLRSLQDPIDCRETGFLAKFISDYFSLIADAHFFMRCNFVNYYFNIRLD